jgi:hypothetical protein
MKRLAETFGKELRIGRAVLQRDGTRTKAVEWAKEKYGRSERNIRKYVALAKRVEARDAVRQPAEKKPIEYYFSPAEISQIEAMVRTPGFKREIKRETGPAAFFLIKTLERIPVI